ncbi:NAD(P)-binding protein [Myriangium duriaei CBS 260.36]|uniref:NAD(P)-binding protein n=1 Tax=Myriangium duriaei CBS 260.36 TaxID=1168546 RepID=A0A9P4J7X9_9PEZI|nr:NAD(P)-binding protein [Myriangium duriaei CBS 260.36]
MASATVSKKIVVCGGNGFLGSRICKAATARGWDVTSISRSGAPKWEAVTSSPSPPPWADKVHWHSASVLAPSTYRDTLRNADAVVHTMGILLEADYKGVLTGKEPIVAGLQRAFSSVKQGTANPLDRREGEDLQPLERDGQITYEVMNRDTAILLAQEAADAKVPVFGYISAAGGAPILPGRYITTKRAAEDTVTTKFPQLRSFFIRASFMYDSSRAYTVALAGPTFASAMVNSLLGGMLSGPLGAAVAKPLKADVVAESVIEAIADEGVKGPVELPQIEALANREWRRGML